MTAEQFLINENEYDHRVRYITHDFGSINLWSKKPDYISVLWKGGNGSWIKTVNMFLDFGNRKDICICIDDIKPEVPPIPETQNIQFYSIRCWIEDRINYINQFIKRNMDSDLCINPEWIAERNELIEKLKNL